MSVDDWILEDGEALIAADRGGMLAAVAAAGATARAAAAQVHRDDLARLTDGGQPRAIVVAGAGGSAAAGDILAAAAGSGSPIPVLSLGGPSLPGWVGASDVVVCVSASGRTPESYSLAHEAIRRGCRVWVIAPAGSPLLELAGTGHGPVGLRLRPPPLAGSWRARSLLWALATPLVLLGGEFGIVEQAAATVQSAADALDRAAQQFSPLASTAVNRAKQLAVETAASLPLIWGSGDVGGVAATRFARQLAENAGIPALSGALPQMARTHSMLFAGPRVRDADTDLFRDRVSGPEPAAALRLVLLRDESEAPITAELTAAAKEVAVRHGVAVSEVVAPAGPPLVRLASLLSVTDFASVYAALAVGVDPTGGVRELDTRLGIRNED